MSQRTRLDKNRAMTVTGIAWYRVDEYERLLEVAVDAPDLEATYDEWKISVERTLTELEAQGMVVSKVEIDIEDLISWCQVRGRALNGSARAEYTSLKVREAHLKLGDQ